MNDSTKQNVDQLIPAPVADSIETLDPQLAPQIAVELGLTLEEYQGVVETQGRVPSLTELYIYSLMWSEHCSYKHSKTQLRLFSSEGPQVIMGPGENAGVIRVGDGWAVAFKMESHNHPSALDPFGGAATGVGGAVRDIFAMGARPIASLDSLRFGTLDDPHQRFLLNGAVEGMGAYGDGLGVPTIGGEVYFEDAYADNCLINAMSIGLMREEELMRAVGSGPGNYVVLLGSTTGRDGIGGASVLASNEFHDVEENESQTVARPTVAQGDPHLEKRLIEACLELLGKGLLVALGDLGAAGLTSSGSEMASRGGVGIDFDVRKVPVHEDAMQPFEIVVSETQERMLTVVRPEDFAEVEGVCKRWDILCTCIGSITDTGRFVVRDTLLPAGADIVADIPAEMLAKNAPIYDPPMIRPAYLDEIQNADLSCVYEDTTTGNEALLALLASPNICSREWVWHKLDPKALNSAVVLPGADAAVLRISDIAGGEESNRGIAAAPSEADTEGAAAPSEADTEGAAATNTTSNRGIAAATDCNGRYCYLDPYCGAQIALAESMRNLACVGAQPAAITDCLNFGNPQKPEVFYTFHKSILGLSEACKHFDIPVVSGNVSFYNESYGNAIYPTPAIGIVGTIDDVSCIATPSFKQAGDTIILVGETQDELGGSEYLKVLHGMVAGAPPTLDLDLEGDVQACVRNAISAGLLESAHDCSEGGIAVTLSESCVAGGIGARIALDDDLPAVASLFSETQSRIVVSVAEKNVEALFDLLAKFAVPYSVIGEVGGDRLIIEDKIDVSLDEIAAVYGKTLELLMNQS